MERCNCLIVPFFSAVEQHLLLARRSEVTLIRNVRVHLLNKRAGPFSFFRLVFLHPDSHSEKEIDEILVHECTHVSQWHSINMLICELVCIICWVNPFVWLLKREVRHNLEYLADDSVLESGYDSRSYQYHLLGLAHTNRSVTSLSNNFNMLHLKNRISMMNKKRSRSIGRTKYSIFIPVVGALLILSNVDAFWPDYGRTDGKHVCRCLATGGYLAVPFLSVMLLLLKNVRSMCYRRKVLRLPDVPVTQSLPLWR
ncbi:MAG: M56 family metallopeptidase [Parabacteroides merdae]